MKILQLIQKPQLRGAEIFASQLSTHLVEMGHEVKIICLLEGAASLPFSGEIMNLKRPLNKRFVDWAGWKMLAEEIAAFKPDVVQANAGDTLKFAVFSKLFFSWKAPIVFRNANKVSEFINSLSKKVFNKFLVNRVSHVISVSELCRLDFIKTYSFQENKTTTVPIGIESQPVSALLAEDLKSIFERGKVLIHVASFVPEKNHTGLLTIVRKLIDRGEDIRIVLIGDGKLKPLIEKQVVDLGLSDRVFLLGYRSDVFSMMRNAQAFVLPSKIEGLPGVILEAMHNRTPVIAYDVGGISEIVRSGETGLLVKSGDEEGFVDAIQNMLNTNSTRMQENAYAMVDQEFKNEAIAKRFLNVYEKVIGN